MISFSREEKATVLAVAACSLASALLVKASGMSLDRLVIAQNEAVKLLFGGSAEFLGAAVIIQLMFSMFFLSLGLSFLSAYGAGNDRYQTGLVSGIISAALLVAVIQTMQALIAGISLIAAFSYAVPLSNTYFKELKKWKFFRTGSNAAGKAFFVINLIIAAGIFILITANAGHYEGIFSADLKATISSAALETVDIDSPLIREQVSSRVSELVDTSPVFQSYIKWLPLLTAFTFWIALEFMRSVIFSNVSGALTSAMLRLRAKK